MDQWVASVRQAKALKVSNIRADTAVLAAQGLLAILADNSLAEAAADLSESETLGMVSGSDCRVQQTNQVVLVQGPVQRDRYD